MRINCVFKLTMVLNSDKFHQMFNKKILVEINEDEYIDHSLEHKGITVLYRNSQYKKRVSFIANSSIVLKEKTPNAHRLAHKLEKQIAEYFNGKYSLTDFTLTGLILTTDLHIESQDKMLAYIRILQRIGKVKGFSPSSYKDFDDESSFCLNGNSNYINFLIYDLQAVLTDRLGNNAVSLKHRKQIIEGFEGILRAEVRLTKPKAILTYTDETRVSGQIVELWENRQQIFMDTFARVVPFGNFYKKGEAIEIIKKDVKNAAMRRKMLRLLTLIPEKKSLRLAQKASNCRNIEKVMDSFAKINLSPVTISKRHNLKYLESLYSYF